MRNDKRKRRHKGKTGREMRNIKVSKTFPVSLKHVAYLSCNSISEQRTASLLKILHIYQTTLCHKSLRTLCILQVMKITTSFSFLREFMFLVGIDWSIFVYYTTLFQVELIRPIPRNEGGRNNE